MSTPIPMFTVGKLQRKLTQAPPGEYISKAIEVKYAEGYTEGHAITITYELKNSVGKKFCHSELFRIKEPTERTYEFEEYLADRGCESYDDFVGMEEKLTLEKQVKHGKTYINITSREPFEPDGDNDGAA